MGLSTRRRRRRVGAAGVVLLLGLAACGAPTPAAPRAVRPQGSAAGSPGPVAFGPDGWSAPSRVRGFGPEEDVSCASPRFCAALSLPDPSLAGSGVIFDGSRWSAPVKVASGIAAAVSCPADGACQAADDTADVLVFARGSWSEPDYVDAQGRVGSVSCPTAGACVAVDNNGDVLVYADRRWSAPRKGPRPDPYLVSCASPAWCLVVGDDGLSHVVEDGRWSGPVQPIATTLPTDLSCAATSACVVVDAYGKVLTYDGTWSRPLTLAPGDELTSLSCPTTTFCLVGDARGDVFTDHAGRWSAPLPLFGGHGEVTSVSCPRPTFCVAVSQSEAAFFRS